MLTITPTTSLAANESRPFSNALTSEWIKFSSVRANKVILGLTAAVGGLTTWAVATFVTDEVLTVAEVFVYSTVLTAAFAAVAGILLFSSEAQHGTLATALAAQPARWVIAASKAITAAAFGLALGAAGMAAGFGGAVLGGLDMGDTSSVPATVLWASLFTSLAGALGLGIGMIVRHGTGAISGLLVWWFAVENLLVVAAPAEVARLLPFDAGYRLLGMDSDLDSEELIAAAFTRPQYALIFGGYTAVALIAGTVLLYRRDAS